MATPIILEKLKENVLQMEEDHKDVELYFAKSDLEKQWIMFFQSMGWKCKALARSNVIEVVVSTDTLTKLKVFIRPNDSQLSEPPSYEFMISEATILRDAGETLPFVVVGGEPIWESSSQILEYYKNMIDPTDLLILGLTMFKEESFFDECNDLLGQVGTSVWSVTNERKNSTWVNIFEVQGCWIVNNYSYVESKPCGWHRTDIDTWYYEIASIWNRNDPTRIELPFRNHLRSVESDSIDILEFFKKPK